MDEEQQRENDYRIVVGVEAIRDLEAVHAKLATVEMFSPAREHVVQALCIIEADLVYMTLDLGDAA